MDNSKKLKDVDESLQLLYSRIKQHCESPIYSSSQLSDKDNTVSIDYRTISDLVNDILSLEKLRKFLT